VTDYSSNWLVDWATCLLVVPKLSWSLSFRIEVVLFHYNRWISHLGVRNANHNDTTSCIIRKIYALTQLASANSHEHSACWFIFWIFNIIDDILELLILVLKYLLKLTLNYKLLFAFPAHLLRQTCASPGLCVCLHQWIRRKEYKNAAINFLTNISYCVAQVNYHVIFIAIIIAEIQLEATVTLL
jgi:hypothetical protein